MCLSMNETNYLDPMNPFTLPAGYGIVKHMVFILVNGTLFLIVVFLLVVLTMVWPPDSPWSPWWRTNREAARAACKLAKVTKKDVVYELGSGDGDLIITAAKEFGAKAVGIEIDHSRYFVSKIRIRTNGVSDKVTAIRDNFFNVDFSPATVVFMYLVPRALERVRPKLEKELKPGTRIISYRYTMNLPIVEQDRKHKLYLYRLPEKKSKSISKG